uniref:Uncharacterized protein n=1 Tax=Amphimedon queenslandica TaxID=400682 RepID=A0A1X7UER8_AMPQE
LFIHEVATFAVVRCLQKKY